MVDFNKINSNKYHKMSDKELLGAAREEMRWLESIDEIEGSYSTSRSAEIIQALTLRLVVKC